MLPRKYRLTTQDLRHFHGVRLTTPAVHALYVKNSLTHDRLAVLISKKIVPKAHDRNYLKRRLHEILHPFVDSSPYKDYLLIVQKSPASKSLVSAVLSDAHNLLTQMKHA